MGCSDGHCIVAAPCNCTDRSPVNRGVAATMYRPRPAGPGRTPSIGAQTLRSIYSPIDEKQAIPPPSPGAPRKEWTPSPGGTPTGEIVQPSVPQAVDEKNPTTCACGGKKRHAPRPGDAPSVASKRPTATVEPPPKVVATPPATPMLPRQPPVVLTTTPVLPQRPPVVLTTTPVLPRQPTTPVAPTGPKLPPQVTAVVPEARVETGGGYCDDPAHKNTELCMSGQVPPMPSAAPSVVTDVAWKAPMGGAVLPDGPVWAPPPVQAPGVTAVAPGFAPGPPAVKTAAQGLSAPWPSDWYRRLPLDRIANTTADVAACVALFERLPASMQDDVDRYMAQVPRNARGDRLFCALVKHAMDVYTQATKGVRPAGQGTPGITPADLAKMQAGQGFGARRYPTVPAANGISARLYAPSRLGPRPAGDVSSGSSSSSSNSDINLTPEESNDIFHSNVPTGTGGTGGSGSGGSGSNTTTQRERDALDWVQGIGGMAFRGLETGLSYDLRTRALDLQAQHQQVIDQLAIERQQQQAGDQSATDRIRALEDRLASNQNSASDLAAQISAALAARANVGMPVWGWALIALAALGVVGGGTYVIVKKAKE